MSAHLGFKAPCGDVLDWSAMNWTSPEYRRMGDKVLYVKCANGYPEGRFCHHVRYCNICGGRYCEAEVVAVEEKEDAS